MGASIAVAAAEEITEDYENPVKGADIFNKAAPLQTDFKFEHFMNRCLALQKEKRSLEMQIRAELSNWRSRAKRGAPTSECRHRLSVLLKGFKVAQEMQDLLIEKEKQRLSNCHFGTVKAHTLEDKLKFFSLLNKQHESILEMVRQDVLDCRSICRQNSDEDNDDDDASRIRCRISSRSWHLPASEE